MFWLHRLTAEKENTMRSIVLGAVVLVVLGIAYDAVAQPPPEKIAFRLKYNNSSPDFYTEFDPGVPMVFNSVDTTWEQINIWSLQSDDAIGQLRLTASGASGRINLVVGAHAWSGAQPSGSWTVAGTN
jgi:hypothetical protein